LFAFVQDRKAAKHSRHAPNRDLGTILGINNAESFNYKSSEQSTPVLKLVLHPRLKKHMKSHQVDGFNFLQKNLIAEEPGGCILAHAPGTGKTFLMRQKTQVNVDVSILSILVVDRAFMASLATVWRA